MMTNLIDVDTEELGHVSVLRLVREEILAAFAP